MADRQDVQIYLEDGLLESARSGSHNFIGLVKGVLEEAGLEVRFEREADRPRDHDGLSLVHMAPPSGRRGLVFRRVYHYPFWQIDQTEKRWDWDVARTHFQTEAGTAGPAKRFQTFWRRRLYGLEDAPVTPDGPVYLPLQGKLTEHRSFQTASPIEMLETTLRLEKQRDVIATLHPKEHYIAADYAALDRLVKAHDRLSVQKLTPADLLPRCAYVVTQNSGVAFDGFLFNKPAILFGRIDFHHIGQSLTRMTAEQAFDRVLDDLPDFAGYAHWFWQEQSINAGRDTAPAKIAARLRRFGWPV